MSQGATPGPRGAKFAVAGFLGALLLRVLRLTWRIDEQPRRAVLDRRAARPEGAPGTIYLCWHSRVLLSVATQCDLGVTAMISEHGDGEYIARTARHMGFETIRGSTTRSGLRALADAVRTLKAGGDMAITPDGPKGPRLVVQSGCVAAAMRSGAPIVPVGLAARRARRLRSWDRFMVPVPFTRLAVRFGEPIQVAPGLRGEEFEAARLQVEKAMRDQIAASAAAVGRPAETVDVDPRDAYAT